LPTINNDDIQQALIADEITDQENQEAIKTLLQITMNKSLKTNINQYLKIVDLTISTEQPLTDTEIVQLVLEEQRDKVKPNDKINQEYHIVSTNKTFNGLKTWVQYLEK